MSRGCKNLYQHALPYYTMTSFGVFSYGIRTRVVMRNDFIDNYTGIENFTGAFDFFAGLAHNLLKGWDGEVRPGSGVQ